MYKIRFTQVNRTLRSFFEITTPKFCNTDDCNSDTVTDYVFHSDVWETENDSAKIWICKEDTLINEIT